MPKYKLIASESYGVTYEIEAESAEQAEDIYYGYELGEMKEVRSDGVEFYPVEVMEVQNA